jgi:uncharacterized protein YndB with AHSA1/START domain
VPVNAAKKLSITTPTETQIVMTRSFDAPLELVWKAMTRPELIRKWLFSPPGWEMVDCTEDVRVGGSYRWAWNGPDGRLAMAVHGVYREVVPLDHMTRTEIFDMGCDRMGEQLVTMAFTRSGAATVVSITSRFQSKQARDGTLASGMEHGMNAGYDRLEALLAGGTIN